MGLAEVEMEGTSVEDVAAAVAMAAAMAAAVTMAVTMAAAVTGAAMLRKRGFFDCHRRVPALNVPCQHARRVAALRVPC